MTDVPEQNGENIRLSLNATVTFTPTDLGREILEEHFKDGIEAVPEGLLAEVGITDSVEEGLRRAEEGTPDEKQPDTVTMQLWQVASLLGPHIYNGGPQVILDNVILVDPSEIH